VPCSPSRYSSSIFNMRVKGFSRKSRLRLVILMYFFGRDVSTVSILRNRWPWWTFRCQTGRWRRGVAPSCGFEDHGKFPTCHGWSSADFTACNLRGAEQIFVRLVAVPAYRVNFPSAVRTISLRYLFSAAWASPVATPRADLLCPISGITLGLPTITATSPRLSFCSSRPVRRVALRS